MEPDNSVYVKCCGLRWLWIAAALAAVFTVAGQAQVDTFLPWEGGASYYAQWRYGPRSDQDFFYIGTWDQSPWNAPLFQGIGFNSWTALYDGTVEIDPGDGPLLPLLRDYKIPTFGDQPSALQTVGTDTLTGVPYATEAAEHLTDPIIDGWMQEDEPDNSQTDVDGNYVDCVPPSPAYYYPACLTFGSCSSTDTGMAGTIPGPSITTLYAQFKGADPNRPVYLGMGQGTGYNGYNAATFCTSSSCACYNGRGGTCCGTGTSRNLSDYPVYAQGGDILAADIYPQNDSHPMWWTGRKTDRLRYWSNYSKPVYDDMEMNAISGGVGPTTGEIDAEFWDSIVHGGHGIIWFTHQFSPTFEEASAFSPEHAAAEAQMAADDIQVNALARVLNTPSVANGMANSVSLSYSGVQDGFAGVNYLLKRYGGFTFLLTENDGLPQNQTADADPVAELSAFCVVATSGTSRTACTSSASKARGSQHMLPAGGTTATFTLAGFPASATATVLGENIHLSNLPTIGDVTPFVADPSDYVSVCGGSFYYDSCGGGVGSLNPNGTFASPATPYYFAPAGPNPIVYVKANEIGAPRTIPVVNGVFSDTFVNSYTRHIYQINFDPNPNAPKIGDLNMDGVVNEEDFQIWLAALGTTAGSPGYDPRADVVRDGVVDTTDLAVLGTPPSLTSGTACNGVFSGTFRGNVTVAEGQNCYFAAGASVSGNLQQSGGNLVLTGATVGGNLQITGGTFSIMGTINGNLQIQDTTGAARDQVCGTTVKGNLQFQNNATGVQLGSSSPSCAGNTIGGNLQVQNNTGSTAIFDSTVGGNLQDQNNTAPTQVFNNTVKGNLQCSNDSSITGGGDSAGGHKQGQCATF